MRILYVQYLRLLLLLLVSPHPVWARDLVWGFVDFPPYYQVQRDQNVAGILIDLMHEIETISDYRFKTYHYPMGRLYEAVEQQRVDVFTSVATPAAVMLGRPSKAVVAKLGVALFTAQPLDTNNLPLKGILAALRGYEYAGTVKSLVNDNPSLTLTRRNNHSSLIKSLAKGRVDYVIDYLEPGLATAKAINFGHIQYRLLKEIPAHLFVANDLAGQEQVLQDLDSLIRRLRPELNPAQVLASPRR